MSQIRLYLDEDAMRRSLVSALRARGFDILTAAEAAMVNRGDHDHLHSASRLGRVIYSHNTGDFCSLHQAWAGEGKPHQGIVVAPQQRFSVGEQLRRLIRLTAALTAEQMTNRIEFLSSWG